MIDSWHGDNKPSETALGRAIDRVLVSKPVEYGIILPLGAAMTAYQLYGAWQVIAALF